MRRRATRRPSRPRLFGGPRGVRYAGAFTLLVIALTGSRCDRADTPGDRPSQPPRAVGDRAPSATGSAPAKPPDHLSKPNTTLPGITIQARNREILLDGRICIESGILEYLAVSRGGKTYESLFELDCQPRHLHAGLLIAGYTAGTLAPEFQGDFAPQATASRPEGAPTIPEPPDGALGKGGNPPSYLAIEVELKQADGSWRRQPLEKLLVNRGTGKPPGRLRWAFTGSFFRRDENTGEEYFIADVEKSLAAFWFDPTALINLAADMGNPYRSEDGGLEVAKTDRPLQGTPVRLVLRPAT
ncbi:MAG TPA: YdjY domain-containing protein [Phycisphaerae bacterium]|nr:YdjY domain-containing protein [Phycisphaerae bacterium]HRY69471.1 YdjY domain-containing protein [Phycisphaerae bacterium]HSA29115.1 YdjY domain-containing protein [Phycisphaerae bacterium]